MSTAPNQFVKDRNARIQRDRKLGFPRPDQNPYYPEWRIPAPKARNAIECSSLPFASSLCSLSPGSGHRHETFPAGEGRSITYDGPWLSQDHAKVLCGLIREVKGKLPAERVTFDVADFLNSINWLNSTYRWNRLWSILGHLRSGTLVCHYTGGERIRKTLDGIICRPEMEYKTVSCKKSAMRKRTVTFNFSPEGLELFRGIDVYLSLDALNKLETGVETWLYMYVKSIRGFKPENLTTMISRSGWGGSVKEFGRRIRTALVRLKAEGLIDGWMPTKRGEVQVFKKRALKRLILESLEQSVLNWETAKEAAIKRSDLIS